MSSESETLEEKPIEKTLDQLDAETKHGLSEYEVKKRQKKYGLNSIEEEEENPLVKLLKNFWGPIPWMLEAAVILSAIAQRWEDFGVILFMLLVNGGVSYWHESKAERAIKALKERLAPQAIVIRDGEEKEIDARQLVPGDIVVLQMGGIIPADVKLLNDEQLSVDESALTGESLPVDKEESDMCYSSTTVKQGEAHALVTAIGENTKFARTVELVESAEEKSHFQKAVLRIGYFLIGATALLVLIMVVVGIIRGDDITQLLIFALVLTIAGIPQALPAVLSVTMTIGANRLARMKAIVSKLSSMEEMAGLEILCADKTGTLTKNELELQKPELIDAEDEEELIIAAALTVNLGHEDEDPIDKAIWDSMEDKDKLGRYDIKDFRPFDPTRKRAEADVSHEGKNFTVAKGAPQVILDLVKDQSKEEQVRKKVDGLGEQGFRSLGVAKKKKATGSTSVFFPYWTRPVKTPKKY